MIGIIIVSVVAVAACVERTQTGSPLIQLIGIDDLGIV